MIRKIISGGQTGADQGALRAAKALGIPTSGMMARGYRTQDGPRPDLAAEYRLLQHPSSKWRPPSSRMNVMLSDATIRFARDFETLDERCNLEFIQKYRKPYLDISIDNPPSLEDVREWLVLHQVEVLYISGNTERQAPGIGGFVEVYLTKLLGDGPSSNHAGQTT